MVYLIVGIAAMIGASLRYLLGLAITAYWNGSFPLATLLVNLIGCFALSFFTTYLFKLPKLPKYIVSGIGTGLIGAFTTFSTFSVESVQLFQSSQIGTAILYILCSLWGGILLSYVGFQLGNKLFIKKTEGGKQF